MGLEGFLADLRSFSFLVWGLFGTRSLRLLPRVQSKNPSECSFRILAGARRGGVQKRDRNPKKSHLEPFRVFLHLRRCFGVGF